MKGAAQGQNNRGPAVLLPEHVSAPQAWWNPPRHQTLPLTVLLCNLRAPESTWPWSPAQHTAQLRGCLWGRYGNHMDRHSFCWQKASNLSSAEDTKKHKKCPCSCHSRRALAGKWPRLGHGGPYLWLAGHQGCRGVLHPLPTGPSCNLGTRPDS